MLSLGLAVAVAERHARVDHLGFGALVAATRPRAAGGPADRRHLEATAMDRRQFARIERHAVRARRAVEAQQHAAGDQVRQGGGAIVCGRGGHAGR